MNLTHLRCTLIRIPMHDGIPTPLYVESFVTDESTRDGIEAFPRTLGCTMVKIVPLLGATSALVPDHQRHTMRTARRWIKRISSRVTIVPDHRTKATVLRPFDVAFWKMIDIVSPQTPHPKGGSDKLRKAIRARLHVCSTPLDKGEDNNRLVTRYYRSTPIRCCERCCECFHARSTTTVSLTGFTACMTN